MKLDEAIKAKAGLYKEVFPSRLHTNVEDYSTESLITAAENKIESIERKLEDLKEALK